MLFFYLPLIIFEAMLSPVSRSPRRSNSAHPALHQIPATIIAITVRAAMQAMLAGTTYQSRVFILRLRAVDLDAG